MVNPQRHNVRMNLIEAIVASAPGIAAIRRDLHAHPELCFKEVRTADVVAAKLRNGASRCTAGWAPRA